ncbi:MAG: hypothetical protein K1X28_10030 [Parachlamydiales bacterium]|nr:hypothetical protein [Parachlamydiales bacterium]
MVTKIDQLHRQILLAEQSPLIQAVNAENWDQVIGLIYNNPNELKMIPSGILVKAAGAIRTSNHLLATVVYKDVLDALQPGTIADLNSVVHLVYDQYWERTQYFIDTAHLYKAPLVCITTLYAELKEKGIDVPERLEQLVVLNKPAKPKPSHCCSIL